MNSADVSPADTVDQAALATALLEPAIYGGDVEHVEKIETHISTVFLAGPYVYKIKKAVNLGFLDFRTLAARHRYCQEELRLNRRFAAPLYLDVVRITGTSEHPVLGGEGPPIEYAVKMHRFPQENLLSRLLERDNLTPSHIDELAQKVASFHAIADVATKNDEFGTPDAVQRPALENFPQIRSVVNDPHRQAALDTLQQWTAAQCTALRTAFDDRKRAGYVRECHGDLHLGNIAVFHNEVMLFDCLEFSEQLRWIDTMNEVAFLVMDLHDRKRPDLAWRLLNRYLELTGDYAGLHVLRFYVAYRAVVRAKIHCLRAAQASVGGEEKQRLLAQYDGYIALAEKQMDRPRPALIVAHGLSGSGKTTYTQPLLEEIGAVRIRSDVERKRLHDIPALARTGSAIGTGLYSDDATTVTYQRLLGLAQTLVRAGSSVIVDATFLKRSQRDLFLHAAQAAGTPFLILDFVAEESTLRLRIVERQKEKADASEANIAVLEHQCKTQEPLQADELASVLRVYTDLPRHDIDHRRLTAEVRHRLAI